MSCDVCFTTHDWRGFGNHHVIPRSRCRGRKGWDSKKNRLRLCGRCHACVHGENEPGFVTLTIGMLLWVLMEDPTRWDRETMERLNAPRSVPDVEPLAICFHEERARNRPMEVYT